MAYNKFYRVYSLLERRDTEIRTDEICNKDEIETKVLLWSYIFDLSADCDIKLSSALRIASQYPHVLDQINKYITYGYTEMPISLFLVYDDKEQYVSCDAIRKFIIRYNGLFEKTGLYIDEDQGDACYLWEYLWEVTRILVNINLPSRFYARKFLKSISDAEDFLERYGNGSIISEVEIINGEYEEFDMEWITNVPINSTYYEAIEFAKNYWNKKQTTNPIIETVFTGTYKLKDVTD